MTDFAESNLLALSTIEAPTKLAAGRAPLIAFVDADSERLLRDSAALIGNNYQIMRGGVTKAIEYLGEHRSPQLLIIDISGVDLPLSKIHVLADVCEPGTNVVAIGDHNDVGLYRDLIDAGVNNYLVKPLTRELLAKALTPKTNSGNIGAASLKRGKMVSFVGARGGVGATTLACNLAWHLSHRQSRRIALVDLDLQQGDCALLLNIDYTPGLRDGLANPLRLDPLLVERIMTQVDERLFVIGSEEPLHENVQITAVAIDTLFSVLRSQFHYVIVDLPRIPAPAYRRALEIADRRVIVVDQTMRSMRDAARLVKLFGSGEASAVDHAEHRNIFVVNRVGEAGNRMLSLEEISSVLRVPSTSVVPFLPTLVSPAAHRGEIVAGKRGKYADAVAALAFELSGQKRRQRWWQRKPSK